MSDEPNAPTQTSTVSPEPEREITQEEPADILPDPLEIIENLRLQLKERDARLQQIQARAEEVEQRMRTEITEARQRLERGVAQRVANARNEFILDLLSIFDNLDLTVQAAEQGNTTATDLVTGVKATQQLLYQALRKHGVERIDTAAGHPFDPDRHEAVDTVEVDAERDGLVVGQMRAGYRTDDQLLRPALVRVGKGRSGTKVATDGD